MLSRLNASQTKYGIVNLIEILKGNHLEDYIQGVYTLPRAINEPQLKGALGVESLIEPLPTYWEEIQEYPSSIGYFCMIAVIFSHHNYINVFIQSSSSNMKGILHKADFGSVKPFTNIRGVLIESKATSAEYSRSDDVPYDLSPLYKNGEVGLLVKELLLDRLKAIGWAETPSSEFTRDFYEQIKKYEFHKVFSLSIEQLILWLEGEALDTAPSDVESINFDEVVTVDTHLLTSLKAKQFLILTGPSGTGKTYGIRQLASTLNPLATMDKNFNITFIPVEAGWKDGKHLIGYRNPFSLDGETYETTPLINLLLKANSSEYEGVPFFVIFDEMNLSHVEMYFSRFLSLIETAKHPNLGKEPMLNVEELKLLKKTFKYDYEYIPLINQAIDKGGLFVSDNVYFIGTVNIDETTYMFSPKVLDRAFVIEKNSVKPSISFGISNNAYFVKMTIGDIYSYLLDEEPADSHPELISLLDGLYEILEDSFPFGYRVVKECNDYIVVAEELKDKFDVNLEWLSEINSLYDEILMQKILPKIHGNRKQLTHVLNELIEFCNEDGNIRFPKSHSKLIAMQRILQITGYSGFVV
ncbi:hypothetical protein SPD48_02390 [Pseudogracilibacillus sp. SE30717A]|uniref:McrB family protein n=1 Tax=Pseudogracilibacillus sp. SE30717A TaxID=3098293 RepID=UPI00300DE2B0